MSWARPELDRSILTAELELIFSVIRSNRSINSAKNEGVLNILKVWPVGAVSKTMRSNPPFLTKFTILAKATTSSVPAGSVSNTSWTSRNVLPIPFPASPESPTSLSTVALNSFKADAGSISSTDKDPSLGGTPIKGQSINCPPRKSISMASPKLWAGSVLIKATLCPLAAMETAREDEVVVFPTPPFPPQITTRCWESSMRCANSGLSIKDCDPTYANAGTPTNSTSKKGTVVTAMGLSELPFDLYSSLLLTSSTASVNLPTHFCCPLIRLL
mmetsp:Transcript_1475/g.3162  ORF Transcript_1475/g.3162 Transcript_1475/m.3162 type:complete len:273 (-) Transcript_1475:885-1703(-)